MTQIFKNYQEFSQREDKTINGVEQNFANNYPDYKNQNESNRGCWNCSRCSGCSDCSDCSGLRLKENIRGEQTQTTTNSITGFPNVPIIENIHQKLYETIKPNGHSNKLKMDNWHTCDTTHCRAGWIIHLAGESGYELESKTSTQFAAMQIYKSSSPIRVSPVRFFQSNEAAMNDIKRCAEEEKQQQLK
jgi:hypothetical protein